MDNDNNIWDKPGSESIPPSTLFAGCIISGIAAILVATYVENTFLNIALPIGIMFYYIYTIRQEQVETLSMEQKADSVYYMGFIFTLVAMTASLVALANSDELLFNTVVANFGLALGTTILGLTVRIIWLQMNSQALEDADAILRDKLIKMSQALYDNNERIVSAMTALSSQMEDVTEPIKENYLKLAKSFDISDQINTKLSDLNINLELASENVQDLASKLEELNPEFNDLNKNAKEAIKVPSFIVAELTQLKGQAANLVEKTQDLALAAERIDEEASEATKTTILGLEMSLRNFDQAILQANELMELNAQHIEDHLSNSKSSLAKSLTQADELMDANAQHIEDHLSNSKSSLEKSLTQADELMDANAQHIEDHLSNSKSALEDSNKLLIDGAELIKDGNRAISKALQQSARQIEQSMNLAEEMEEANEGSQETKD